MTRSRFVKVSIIAVVISVASAGVATAVGSSGSGGLVYGIGTTSTLKSLSGASVPTGIHVSIGSANIADVKSVAYFLDNAKGTGTPSGTVTTAPFDTGAITFPKAGTHSVLAVITTTTGLSYDLFARFNVTTAAAPTQAAPTAGAVGTVAGGATPAKGTQTGTAAGAGAAGTTGGTPAATSTAAMVPNGNIPGQWTMTWNDEFNGAALDTSKWKVDSSPGGNNEDETACFQPSAVTQSGGSLNIALTDEGCKSGGRKYVGGQVRTASFAQAYGFFEARMYIPGSGSSTYNFPAFWIVPSSKCWPSGGEFDIMETIGGSAKASYGNGTSCNNVTNGWPHADPGGGNWVGWHTFAVDWEKTGFTVYYDGKKVGQTITDQVSSTPMNVLIDNVSRPMGGKTVAPAILKTDYVRVWKKG